MKKLKLLIIFMAIFCLTGCSVEYNVEIYNDEARVNGTLIESNKDRWNEKVYDNTYKETIDLKTQKTDDFVNFDGMFKIDNESGLGIGLKSKYSLLERYSYSPGIKACYEYFNVMNSDKEIIISTNAKNKCFDEYPNLDKIIINLKTNHKVLDNNAKTVDGYHYYWEFSREDKDDATIYVSLSKKDYIFNYENEFIKKMLTIVIVTGIIVGSGSIIYFYFKKRNAKLNEI